MKKNIKLLSAIEKALTENKTVLYRKKVKDQFDKPDHYWISYITVVGMSHNDNMGRRVEKPYQVELDEPFAPTVDVRKSVKEDFIIVKDIMSV